MIKQDSLYLMYTKMAEIRNQTNATKRCENLKHQSSIHVASLLVYFLFWTYWFVSYLKTYGMGNSIINKLKWAFYSFKDKSLLLTKKTKALKLWFINGYTLLSASENKKEYFWIHLVSNCCYFLENIVITESVLSTMLL